jgi:hypothetical protein
MTKTLLKISTLKHRTNKLLKKKLDKLWSELVKKRAKGRCEMCGKNTSLNSHHIISRSNLTLRWDLHNGVCLCVSCHSLSNFSAHKDPLGFTEWLACNRKSDMDYLMVKKNERFDKDYERIEKELSK